MLSKAGNPVKQEVSIVTITGTRHENNAEKQCGKTKLGAPLLAVFARSGNHDPVSWTLPILRFSLIMGQ
jgi:hypothetical protein